MVLGQTRSGSFVRGDPRKPFPVEPLAVTASERSYGQAVVPAVVPEGPGAVLKFCAKKS